MAFKEAFLLDFFLMRGLYWSKLLYGYGRLWTIMDSGQWTMVDKSFRP